MKVLLVWLPFCTPVSPPYSLANIYSFLKNNGQEDVEVLDLNLEFHKWKFSEYQKYFQDINKWQDYGKVSEEYNHLTLKVYSENNKKVIKGQKPELFKELLRKITERKPKLVAFSIVYSSQAFYAYALLKELKNITTIIGGPAVNEKLVKLADQSLKNEVELLKFITGHKMDLDQLNRQTIPDFSIYNLKEYFTQRLVIPIKTSSSCYYKQCSFCTHFSQVKYEEYDLNLIKKTVVDSKQKYFFMIDDMISAQRLLKIAEVLKPLDVCWTCQLKPTKVFDLETLRKLKEAGLIMIMWGIESGNQRILDLMNKGTKVPEIVQVLKDAHEAGIKNIAYTLFGFPTEAKEDFLETIEFLESNKANIDLINISIFGLQKGTAIYNDPKKFGIKKIIEEERTVLEPKITYELSFGLTQQEVTLLLKSYKQALGKINKYPQTMNFFREHMLYSIK